MAGAPHMPLAPPQPAALGAPQALAAAWQPARGISAATVLMAERQAGGSAPPPPPAAGGGGAAAGSPSDDEELSDDEAADAMAEAFERLIQAAFEMVQQGKPMEAEYVLAEGAPLLGGTLVRLPWASDGVHCCASQCMHAPAPRVEQAGTQRVECIP